MDETLKKRIIKTKEKELTHLKKHFDVGFIRSAAFSVGTDFCSARVGLQDNRNLPLVLPLVSRIVNCRHEIDNYHPFRLARSLSQLKVPAVLVATDSKFLGGDLSHINPIKTGSEISVVRYDFIIDEVQIYQSKSLGADGILLDAALLTPEKLAEFAEITFSIGLEPFLKIERPTDLQKVEPELIAGLVLDQKGFTMLGKNGSKGILSEFEKKEIPVLLIHKPGHQDEAEEWRQQGIRYFLFPDDWLLERNPLRNVEKVVNRIWPSIPADL